MEKKRFSIRRHPLGGIGLTIIAFFLILAIYAPFFASSKPFFISYRGEWYFPFFRYLFYQGFYTKRLDIFFNLLIFIAPLMLLIWVMTHRKSRGRKIGLLLLLAFQLFLFIYLIIFPIKNPASDSEWVKEREEAIKIQRDSKQPIPDWEFDLRFMNDYARLNLLIKERLGERQYALLAHYQKGSNSLPLVWKLERVREKEKIAQLQSKIRERKGEESRESRQDQVELKYLIDKQSWISEELKEVSAFWLPLFRPFHWEEDAGGSQELNQEISWWDLTRINRKDLVAALIFGTRISLVVGTLAVFLGLLIGIPIGALAGYYGGKLDLIVSRLLEIWESMPVFFMLLLIVAIGQSKSIFLIILVIGLFSWTSFSRYIRAEFFKQRNLPYIEACHAMGFNDGRIIFSHILPNAIPPLLTLLPFAVMGAITSEAALSFLGLGEEGSCSWGVLMDEGRSAFPAESYLLWPPAILLTILLIAIALVGDALRDALDPRS